MKLGINVDHVATLRQARGTIYPDPVMGALLAQEAGADSIVVHLREDRRHIRERDVLLIKESLKIPLNLEMAVSKDIVEWALKIMPYQATLVPEKRQELTTEGGLDLKDSKNYKKIEKVVTRLQAAGIKVSLFMDPSIVQIKKARQTGAVNIEIHTGKFADATTDKIRKKEFEKIKAAAKLSKRLGFFVAAGHGLHYDNVEPIAKIKEIEELNIGHSIIARSLFLGLIGAVKEMKILMAKGKRK